MPLTPRYIITQVAVDGIVSSLDFFLARSSLTTLSFQNGFSELYKAYFSGEALINGEELLLGLGDKSMVGEREYLA